MLNSKLVNEKRNQEKALRGTTEISEYFFGRNLEFKEDTDKICERGSKELKEYYSTGDPSKFGIEEIKEEDRPEHIKALINMINEGTSGGEGLEDNAMTYVKHLIPVFFFLAVAILAIPGWIVCCSCCCCNCYCCCCCIKQCCQLPFYIVTNVMYAIVVGVSIYGLSQSNSIFVGLADTECSLLRFLGEILDGETKGRTPKWGGIDKIKNKLQETVTKINGLKGSVTTNLSNTKTDVTSAESTFKGKLKGSCTTINGDTTNYNYNDYRLDIAGDYGTFGESEPTYPLSFVGVWYNEYKTISEQTTTNMESVESNFDEITKNDEMTDTLSDVSTQFEDIKNSIDSVKGEISDVIINNSDTIEDYGKLGFKIVFSVLTVIDVAIAALMFLFCFCSGKPCSSCCFIRCGLKIVLHILWNIMALLMILTFLIGTIFALVGTIGKDLTSAVSFIVGEENLGKGEEAILLGEAAGKLNICINKDGDITGEIDLNNDNLDSFDKLKTLESQIIDLELKSKNLQEHKIAFNNYTRILDERASYSDINYNLIDDSGNKLNLRDKVANLNSNTQNIKDKWEFDQNLVSCPKYTRHTDGFLSFNPYNCIPSNRYDSSSVSDPDKNDFSEFSTLIDEVSGIVKAQNYANTNANTGDSATSIREVINALNIDYSELLRVQTEGLTSFREKIQKLTGIFAKFVGKNDDFFSFLNCKFIGTNIKVLLKALENSLGKDFYTVGVCLLLSGFSMAVGISFTILLMVIINSNAGKK
jgi:hypothetical protein